MNARALLDKIKNALAPLIFVPRCSACLTVVPSKNMALCPECMRKYELESKYLCTGCKRSHRYCTCKIENDGSKLALVHITAYDIRRSSVSKSMILNLKDNKFPGAFDFLAEELYETVKMRYARLFEGGNVVVTHVPRSDKAQKKAGHDQSKEIAERFGRLSGAPAVTLFENISETQQKQLTAEQRRENANKSYRFCDENVSLAGKVLLMIDDITTTGATLSACARLAKDAYAKAVIALVCARVDRESSVDENDYLIYGEEEENEYWN